MSPVQCAYLDPAAVDRNAFRHAFSDHFSISHTKMRNDDLSSIDPREISEKRIPRISVGNAKTSIILIEVCI